MACFIEPQAIEERLKTLVFSDEDDISSMMGFAHIKRGESNEAAKVAKRIEKSSLESLGSVLASCVAKLLHLTKISVDNTSRVLTDARIAQAHESYRSLQLSSRCLLTALNHSQIETNVSILMQAELGLWNQPILSN